MRTLFCCLALLLFLVPAEAQIVGIRLKTKKLEKKYRKVTSEIDGETLIVGEFKDRISFARQTGSIKIQQGAKDFELWVSDVKNPGKVPYKIDGDSKVAVSKKKGFIRIMVADIPQQNYATILSRDQTLFGLSSEYRLKNEAIEASAARIKEIKKGTTPWFNAQRQLMARYDRMGQWLSAGVFKKASKKWFAKAEGVRKLLKGDALAERKNKALKSVRPAPNPAGLGEVHRNGKKFTMTTVESQHCRLIADITIIPPKRALELLRTAENIIEGFRRELVDPFAHEFEDRIPDEIFVEFFYMHDDVGLYEAYWNDFYHRSFGEHRERQLKSGGLRARNARAVPYVHFSRFKPEGDLEGSIAHSLGHDLANIHFNNDRLNGAMDWLEEGCAYYVSFEFLGRNSVTCYQFKRDKYDTKAGAEGLKTLQQGQRASFNALALKAAVPLHALMPKELFQMQDADLAKSWSFFDFLAHQKTDKIVEFLRAACDAANRKGKFHGQVREVCGPMFGLQPGDDVFKYLDVEWKKYAKSGQKKQKSKRRTRR